MKLVHLPHDEKRFEGFERNTKQIANEIEERKYFISWIQQAINFNQSDSGSMKVRYYVRQSTAADYLQFS